MGRRVNVIGVGMTKFAKPGASEDYNVMAAKAAQGRARGRRASTTTRSSRPTPATSTATAPAASAPSTRSASPASRSFNVNNNCSTGSTALFLGAPGDRGRPRRVRARARLREDGEGRARLEVQRPHQPARAARRRDERGAGLQRRRRPPRRCSAAPAASTAGSTARSARPSRKVGEKARKHAANNPYALFNQPLSRRGDPGLATRSSIRSPATSAARRPAARPRRSSAPTSSRKKHGIAKPVVHRRAGDDDRLRVELRDDSMIKMVGYDMAEAAREEGLRAGGPRPGGRRRRRAARLLHRQRAPHLRGARPLQGGRGREVHLGRRQHLRRQVRHQPVGRPALEGPSARRDRPRAVHRARLAAPRAGGQAPGRGREGRAAAQPRPRRRLRRHHVPQRLARGGPMKRTLYSEEHELFRQLVPAVRRARGQAAPGALGASGHRRSRDLAQGGRGRLPLPVARREVRRRRRRLPALVRGHGGAGAHLRVGLRHVAALRHRRAVPPRVRQRGAEAALAARLRLGRARHRHRDDRAGHRLRPRRHRDDRGARRRLLRDQRREDVHLERHPLRPVHRRRQDRSRSEERAPRHLAVRRRGGHARLRQGQEAEEDGHGVAGHQRAGVRGLPRPRREPARRRGRGLHRC